MEKLILACSGDKIIKYTDIQPIGISILLDPAQSKFGKGIRYKISSG
jgi:hypothetical protein